MKSQRFPTHRMPARILSSFAACLLACQMNAADPARNDFAQPPLSHIHKIHQGRHVFLFANLHSERSDAIRA